MLHEELGGAAISPKTVCSAVAEDAPETPAVVGGTRKRKGADRDGVRVIAQDKHKKARAHCEHNKQKAQCKVSNPFRARSQTLLPKVRALHPQPVRACGSPRWPPTCLARRCCGGETTGVRRLCIVQAREVEGAV